MRVENVSQTSLVDIQGPSYQNLRNFSAEGTLPQLNTMAKRSLLMRKIFISPVRAIRLYYKAMRKVLFEELS